MGSGNAWTLGLPPWCDGTVAGGLGRSAPETHDGTEYGRGRTEDGPTQAADRLRAVGDLRYADAGVDIDEGNRAVNLIRKAVTSTHTAPVLAGFGSYGGMFALDTARWRQPILVSSTDSVGTKVKVAIATGRHRGIGADVVN